MDAESLQEPSWRPLHVPDGERGQRPGTGAAMAETLAHTLNNLMSSVLGDAALLRDALPPGHPGFAQLDAIQRAAEEAVGVSRHLLSLAQSRPSPREPVNLNTIVYHLLLTEEQRLAPHIRIIRYIHPDLWKAAASHNPIVQVVLELARNAIESLGGKGTVNLSTRNMDFNAEPPPEGSNIHGGRYVLFSVEDNGCGMSAETRAKVFEPGFTTKDGHPGMGLAQAQAIVAEFGGYIGVSSVEGEGSTFRVYLPMAEDSEPAAGIPDSDLAHDGETVLVIDDEPMILSVTRETLERLGYRTLAARNGREGVDVARSHHGPIHAALLDLVMPVMGGAEAYPLLREARPDMRIIVCTGLEPDVVSNTFGGEGAVPLLRKPVRPATLARELRKVLDPAVF